MSTTLRHLRKRGIEPRLVSWDQVELEVEAQGEPDTEVLARARELKPQILEELRREHIARATCQMDGRGWVRIRSTALGEDVVFLRDSNVELPPPLRSLVSYTLDELRHLCPCPPESLQAIHEVKRTFGGAVTRPRLDPRPDLLFDSMSWEKLLEITRSEPIYGPLRGLRCCGARLSVRDGRWHLGYWPGEGFSDDRTFSDACKAHLDSAGLDRALTRLPLVAESVAPKNAAPTLDLGLDGDNAA